MDPLLRLVLFAIGFLRLDRVFRFSVRFRVQRAGRSVFKLPLFGEVLEFGRHKLWTVVGS